MSTLRTSVLWLMAISLCISAAALSAPTIVRSAAGAADERPLDLIGRLKAKVKDDQPFQLCVRIRLKSGTEEKFAAEAAKAAKATAAEPGCEGYTFYGDLEEPGTVTLFEKWKSIAALEAHLKQPHVVSLLKLMADLGATPSVQLLGPLVAQKSAP